MAILKTVLKALLSLIFVGGGINHFVTPEFYVNMMPDYLPLHLELVWLSGVIEIILGVGIWIKKYQQAAAWGMIALMIAVFPAHVHMYMHADRYPEVPEIALILRMPMQGVLMVWAWWYTRSAH